MEQAWAKSVDETCKFFNVDEQKGYSDDQVKRAQEKYGPNGGFFLLFESPRYLVNIKANYFKIFFRVTHRRRQTIMEINFRTIR